MEGNERSHVVSTARKRERKALLVSVYRGQNESACQEHLDELELLCETYHLLVVGKVTCGIRRFDPATLVTKGKLEELVARAQSEGAELVVFDDELAPSQQRNLEKLFKIPVIDRTEVILGIFASRAHTKEAHLQVELAQLKYQAPRLKRMWTHLSRQQARGGGAFLKGEGEKQIEIDRRLIGIQIDRVQRQLREVKAHRTIKRKRRVRSGIPTFALVGYTNAGKSTLLNQLTDADSFVEDKLFATLDTTTRKYTLSNRQQVLVIDTVGFIRKLPHLLVAAFRSTLEEAVTADVLIHVVDASHPAAEEQIEATLEVLKELGAEEKPMITVLNQMDRCQDLSQVSRVRLHYPKTVLLSALTGEGLEVLEKAMREEVKKQRHVLHLRIPQQEYHLVTDLLRDGLIREQEYEENDVLLTVEVPALRVASLAPYLAT